jgi:hypothetical protein
VEGASEKSLQRTSCGNVKQKIKLKKVQNFNHKTHQRIIMAEQQEQKAPVWLPLESNPDVLTKVRREHSHLKAEQGWLTCAPPPA